MASRADAFMFGTPRTLSVKTFPSMPSSSEAFKTAINSGYTFKGESSRIGLAILNGEPVEGADIYLPLGMMNRHGLIAGATGTGKTKTLQMITEALSDASVPTLVMDIKGDFSGIAAPGTPSEKLSARIETLKVDWKPQAFPVELLSLSGGPGLPLRATVSEFGPILLSRTLGLNDTQSGLVAMLFKWADDQQLPLLDLKDFIKVLQYASGDGKAEMEAAYGKISTTSTGTILRKVIELQGQGADTFFGEKSFEVEDLMRIADDGRGYVNILRVMDMQDRPKLFSTFMLQLLAELYATLPEEGDLEKPKLVLFIDEAHLIFSEASSALLSQLETCIKLIRSKGVGVFFITQNPQDIPASILSQLGMRVQHALRAFTAADRKAITKTAENFPQSEFYKTDELLTGLGIGEALVTMLNEKGIPTPLAHTMLMPPRSRMDVLTDAEVSTLSANSRLMPKYATPVDSESAYEMLTEKLQEAAERSAAEAQQKVQAKEAAAQAKEQAKVEAAEAKAAEKAAKNNGGFLDNPIVRQAGRTAASIVTRSLLGALGLGGRSRRRSSSGGGLLGSLLL